MIDLMMVVSMGLGGVLLTEEAEGALIRHTFSGTINHVVAGPPPAPWEGAGLGSTWELSYVFDTSLPDHNPGDTRIGFYTIDNGSISMDGVELFAVFGEITVHDGLLGFDEYHVLLFDLPLGDGGVSLSAPPGTLASDEVPVDLNLAEWNFGQIQFGGGGAGFNFLLQGPVFSFTSTVVPSPAGLSVIILSSCLCVGNRRRRNPR